MPQIATRPLRRSAQRRLEMVAADVVEIDIDAFRRGPAQEIAHRPGLVVERGVQPELVQEVRDLLVGARASDDPVAADLGHLGGEAADGAGRGGDPDDVAVAQSGDVEEADVGGEPVAPSTPR